MNGKHWLLVYFVLGLRGEAETKEKSGKNRDALMPAALFAPAINNLRYYFVFNDRRKAMNRNLNSLQLNAFRDNMICEEKSSATIQKYMRDVRAFMVFAGNRPVTKELVVVYKNILESKYAVRSVNSMLAALNNFFSFLGWAECRVKFLRCQQQSYCPVERELTKADYLRLLQTSKK